jgi:hypothetical protein
VKELWALLVVATGACGKDGTAGSWTWVIDSGGDREAAGRLFERRLEALELPDGASFEITPSAPQGVMVVVHYACQQSRRPDPALIRRVLTRQGRLGIHAALPDGEPVPPRLARAIEATLGSPAASSRPPKLVIDGLDLARARAAVPDLARAAPGWMVLPEAAYEGTLRADPKPPPYLWVLRAEPDASSVHVVSAKRVNPDTGGLAIQVELNDVGAARFGALTARMTGQFVAMVLDDEILNVPKVMEPILGGAFQILLWNGTPLDHAVLVAILNGPGLPGAPRSVSEVAKPCPAP